MSSASGEKRPARGRRGLALAAFALLVAVLVATAGAERRAAAAADPTVEFERTFEPTGVEQELEIPAGVRSVEVTALGGRGSSASSGTVAGGQPALVEGAVGVTPGSTLYVEVGGNGSLPSGGFNGGARGGTGTAGMAEGGGGGGASDVRTVSREEGEGESLGSRLLVAAGGGGAGASANAGRAGAVGGDGGAVATGHEDLKGFEGARAESAGPENTEGSGGFGGKGGTLSQGGAGGKAGRSYSGSPGEVPEGEVGAEGHQGRGGHGGDPGTAAGMSLGLGGGGGGGLYGGGGGGGGAVLTNITNPTATGGGGGGGGSSKVPSGGTSSIESNTSSTPYVRVEYRIPGTAIGGPTVTAEAEPTFSISSEEEGASFECDLDEAGWQSCEASFTTPELEEGSHRLEARAENSTGNFDPTPAVLEFAVVQAPPQLTILSGPSGATTATEPAFAFAATTEAPPVGFECGFDSAPLGACSGTRSDHPAAPLAPGPHTFTVRATDAVGNSAEATRSFTVEEAQQPSGGGGGGGSTGSASGQPSGSSGSGQGGGSGPAGSAELAPRLVLGKLRRHPASGSATLVVRVDGAGTVAIRGRKLRTARRHPGGAGALRLPVRLRRGRATRLLRRRGREKVRLRVGFRLRSGGSVTKRRLVKLVLRHPAAANRTGHARR